MADTPSGKYPYAGVPWYNTAFGRTALLLHWKPSGSAPALSRDVLLFLAANQADSFDEAMDAEPGKIMHETRGGEMVALNEVPFKKYYGTIDATPLFVMLSGEYYNRTADFGTIKSIWPNIVKAIDWINMLAIRMATVSWSISINQKTALLMGEKGLAEKWRNETKKLKEKFNDVFWDRERECFVLALDGNKQPCRVKSSNAGQVLFTGIADPGKAKKLINTLLKPDMFNGWGIRTISKQEIRYNPMYLPQWIRMAARCRTNRRWNGTLRLSTRSSEADDRSF